MKRYLIILVATLGLSSCSDFLSEYSQNLSYITCAEDLNELLICESYMPTMGSASGNFTDYAAAINSIAVLDDDMQQYVYKATSTYYTGEYLEGFYTWQPYPYYGESGSTSVTGGAGGDNMWSGLYGLISGCNVILEEIEDYPDDALYSKVKGEALALRALWYFHLNQYWGAAYCAETADTDLGVPVKTDAEISTEGFARNTVAEVYAQMISDLEESIILLDNIVQLHNRRINQTAARILLSRIYLHMENWDKCAEHALNAINDSGSLSLFNFNDKIWMTATYQIALTFTYYNYAANGYSTIVSNYQNWSENVFLSCYTTAPYMMRTTSHAIQFNVADELYDLYESNDKRKSLYMYKDSYTGGYKGTAVASAGFVNAYGIFMPEAYLNYAEAMFLLGDRSSAETALAALRSNRYTTGTDYEAAYTTISGDAEFMQFIRDERRRELAFRGHRWGDLRRYAIHSKYPVKTTIKRYFNVWDEAAGTSIQTGCYELGTYPEDGGWWLPFPYYAIRSNDGLLEDNIRPDRPLLQDADSGAGDE
ncbi:MAG: RagB/SusD family nutrient uptake outer membrane protein [Rikenellaceae bacterium]